ncbi:MAG: hypothetical protein IKH49_10810 [Bacteroidales bacterium]|nr:hypothetical protein [Bacteroidales bacterium]MBR6933775.1 hypothetical protein [Bacteroidales bacterium]
MKTNVFTRLAIVLAVLFTFSMLTSCQSKEEKVLSQMESLCKTAEKESFNVQDIDSLQEKFDAVRQTAKECNFTDDQVKELTKLEVRFTKAIAKKAVERIGNAVEGALEGLSTEKN